MRAADLQSLIEFQGYQCALSGRPLSPDDCELDHCVPLSRGGQHVRDNVQLVTSAINRAKGAMTSDEFVQMCVDVAVKAGRVGASHYSYCG
jgi:5-methylcytosine-specific restriction endonuclease McrA